MATNITDTVLELLITPTVRWIVVIANIIMVAFAYNQEVVRYSTIHGFMGIPYNWQMYILVLLSVFGSFITFLGLWLTIPFTTYFPKYWYIPIFILLLAYYLQNTIDLQPVSGGDFSPPPTHILPKKYRIIIVWCLLILDIIIFTQYYVYFGVFDYGKNTYLHRYISERFGGWYDGKKFAFLSEWLGLFYVALDLHNIYQQSTFEACTYKLPQSWNF
jgi:hypothetical protein